MSIDSLSPEKEFREFEKLHIEFAVEGINKIRELAKILNRESEFEGYSWIKVKSFKFDKNKTFGQNLFDLKIHHCHEVFFLSDKIKELEGLLQ